MEKYNIKLTSNISGLVASVMMSSVNTVLRVPEDVSDEKAVELIRRGVAEVTEEQPEVTTENENLRTPKNKKNIKTDMDLINQDKKKADEKELEQRAAANKPEKLTEEALSELEKNIK